MEQIIEVYEFPDLQIFQFAGLCAEAAFLATQQRIAIT
jgi:hypothetical protein